MAVFFLGALLSALAPSFWLLVLARFVQGIGGAATVVVMYSAIRDQAVGATAARLLSVVVALCAIAPVIAPALGGFIVEAGGWRWSSAAMAVAAPIAGWLNGRLGPPRTARLSAIVLLPGTVVLGAALASGASIGPVLAGMLLTTIGIGMAEPSLAGITVSAATRNVGIYSSVMGTLQDLLGAAGTPLSGAALGGCPGTWGLALVVVAGAGLVVTWLGTRPVVAEAGPAPTPVGPTNAPF